MKNMNIAARRKAHRQLVLAGSALLTLIGGQTALAQDAAPAEDQVSQAEDMAAGGIGDIVVTAQRRSEASRMSPSR